MVSGFSFANDVRLDSFAGILSRNCLRRRYKHGTCRWRRVRSRNGRQRESALVRRVIEKAEKKEFSTLREKRVCRKAKDRSSRAVPSG